MKWGLINKLNYMVTKPFPHHYKVRTNQADKVIHGVLASGLVV